MKLRTGAQPPLAKFAASSFGVVERLAEPGPKPVALLPVTLRNVEHDLKAKSLQPGAKVADLAIKNDSDIIKWYLRVQAFNNTSNESRETPILDKSVSTQQLSAALDQAQLAKPTLVVDRQRLLENIRTLRGHIKQRFDYRKQCVPNHLCPAIFQFKREVVEVEPPA